MYIYIYIYICFLCLKTSCPAIQSLEDPRRKHSELARGAEMRDRLEQQLMSYTQQLNQAGSTVKAAMGRVGS